MIAEEESVLFSDEILLKGMEKLSNIANKTIPQNFEAEPGDLILSKRSPTWDLLVLPSKPDHIGHIRVFEFFRGERTRHSKEIFEDEILMKANGTIIDIDPDWVGPEISEE